MLELGEDAILLDLLEGKDLVKQLIDIPLDCFTSVTLFNLRALECLKALLFNLIKLSEGAVEFLEHGLISAEAIVRTRQLFGHVLGAAELAEVVDEALE